MTPPITSNPDPSLPPQEPPTSGEALPSALAGEATIPPVFQVDPRPRRMDDIDLYFRLRRNLNERDNFLTLRVLDRLSHPLFITSKKYSREELELVTPLAIVQGAETREKLEAVTTNLQAREAELKILYERALIAWAWAGDEWKRRRDYIRNWEARLKYAREAKELFEEADKATKEILVKLREVGTENERAQAKLQALEASSALDAVSSSAVSEGSGEGAGASLHVVPDNTSSVSGFNRPSSFGTPSYINSEGEWEKSSSSSSGEASEASRALVAGSLADVGEGSGGDAGTSLHVTPDNNPKRPRKRVRFEDVEGEREREEILGELERRTENEPAQAKPQALEASSALDAVSSAAVSKGSGEGAGASLHVVPDNNTANTPSSSVTRFFTHSGLELSSISSSSREASVASETSETSEASASVSVAVSSADVGEGSGGDAGASLHVTPDNTPAVIGFNKPSSSGTRSSTYSGVEPEEMDSSSTNVPFSFLKSCLQWLARTNLSPSALRDIGALINSFTINDSHANNLGLSTGGACGGNMNTLLVAIGNVTESPASTTISDLNGSNELPWYEVKCSRPDDEVNSTLSSEWSIDGLLSGVTESSAEA